MAGVVSGALSEARRLFDSAHQVNFPLRSPAKALDPWEGSSSSISSLLPHALKMSSPKGSVRGLAPSHTVLVVGGDTYVGQLLCQQLLRDGWRVRRLCVGVSNGVSRTPN